ncbi:MAG TPA: GGDEF domain-containing protein [Acidimicrobiales bacterium]
MDPSESAEVEPALRTRPVALAFAGVLIAAEVSAALPPGPAHGPQLGVSAVLLTVALVLAAFRRERSRVPDLVPPLLVIASTSLLTISIGGSYSGLVALVMVPIAWAALYLRWWHSVTVVAASAVAVWVNSALDHDILSVLARRVVLWSAVGLLVSVATHALRTRLEVALQRRGELLHQAEALGAAARLLNQIHEPREVVTIATRLGALLASSPGQPPRRAHYLRIAGRRAHFVSQYEELSESINEVWPLSEAPLIQGAVNSGTPVSGSVGDLAGPTAGRILGRMGVTHAAWIPVRVNGEVDGLFVIASSGQPIPDELLKRGIELAQIIELALTNAISMQDQKRLSRTDPVTGLANRRGFELALRRRPHEESFTILSMDLDGLKAVNDSYGHAVGDQLLMLVSSALQSVLRDDDVLARLGGDEFAAILFGASPSQAEGVASRILNALGEVHLGDVTPRISIGIAMANSDEDPDVVGLNADRAMYRAKRLGGMRYEVAAA